MVVMRGFEDNSVDALVTDPPAGIGFMGKEWDIHNRQGFMFFISGVMKECLRVLKPGAHGLVWAIPRTSHWTGMALEDAGFEVRDCVYHVFGSGFPKSLNLGKEVDRLQGNEREVVGERHRNVKPYDDNNGWNRNNTTGDFTYTKGTSPWEGWGTALKPAVECWWLVRKPISEKTIAENVLKWGTGGLNIEMCRVGSEVLPEQKAGQSTIGTFERYDMVTPQRTGRFPSHLIHDGSDEVVDGMGSASRFFYCAKASKAERGEDNRHPTVKPIALMEYLIKLITPPKGTVLDPFMGSGSTGVAAKKLGFNFIGIEKEPEYFKIAEARINATQGCLL